MWLKGNLSRLYFPFPHAATLDGDDSNAVYLRGIFIPES